MTVPTGTVADVLDWVGDDPARAEEALEAEYAGQNRSTLVDRLEAITAAEEATPVSDTTADPGYDEETGLAPGPEAPVEVVLDPEDESTNALGSYVRDADVEVPEQQELIPSDAVQVEALGAAGAPHGFILVINHSDAYAFNPQVLAMLKQIVDKAIAGVTL